jgi:hypothetical protein
MVLGRFKEAVSDVAETIRRAFRDPPCRGAEVGFARPGVGDCRLMEAAASGPEFRLEARTQAPGLGFPAELRDEPMGFEARLCREDGWTAWAAGAQVCELPLFRAESQARVEIPPLPRTAAVRRVALAPFRPGSRAIRDPLQVPATRSHAPGFRPARTFRNRELVLGMPISIAGEDFSRLPKVLNMRFTVQLVKATGENIRKLDVLGVYRVPVKGVVSLRHDPATGRLLVDLGPEALGVARGRFILARRKDDRSYVSCFVEE